MIEPGDILESTLEEMKRVLVEMKKTKDIETRKDLSEILRNLCQSSGVFFDLMSEAMLSDGFPDDEEMGFFEEE